MLPCENEITDLMDDMQGYGYKEMYYRQVVAARDAIYAEMCGVLKLKIMIMFSVVISTSHTSPRTLLSDGWKQFVLFLTEVLFRFCVLVSKCLSESVN